MIEVIGMVIVALISLIGVIIQTNSNSKIDQLRKESKDGDKKLEDKINYVNMNDLKRFLITEMSKIKQGAFIPTENEKRVIAEAKDEYNKAGGDSYVDDMYDELKKQGLI